MTLELAQNLAGAYAQTGIRFEEGAGEYAGRIYMHDPSTHDDDGFYVVTDWTPEKLRSYLEQAAKEENELLPPLTVDTYPDLPIPTPPWRP